MKSTVVDSAGVVRCPVCGASDFSDKRTIKGKIAVGVLAPKRLKCRGCGANLKKSGGDREAVDRVVEARAEAIAQPAASGDRPSRESFRRRTDPPTPTE